MVPVVITKSGRSFIHIISVFIELYIILIGISLSFMSVCIIKYFAFASNFVFSVT